jgi:hypothetical protein
MYGFPDPQNSQASNRLASSNFRSHAKCAPPSMAFGSLDGSLFGDIARQLSDSIQGTHPPPDHAQSGGKACRLSRPYAFRHNTPESVQGQGFECPELSDEPVVQTATAASYLAARAAPVGLGANRMDRARPGLVGPRRAAHDCNRSGSSSTRMPSYVYRN